MSAIPSVASAEAAAYTTRLQTVTMGHRIPQLNNLTSAEQAREVGRQFEAILVRQLLDESIGKSLMGNDGAQSSVYGYMMTDLFADKLTQGKGLGLGQMIARQLTPHAPVTSSADLHPAAAPAPEKSS